MIMARQGVNVLKDQTHLNPLIPFLPLSFMLFLLFEVALDGFTVKHRKVLVSLSENNIF